MGVITAIAAVGAVASIAGGVMSATKKNQVPTLQAPKFESPEDAQNQYLKQGGNLDALQKMNTDVNNRDNKDYRTALSSIDPSLMANVAKNGVNIASFLKGDIPQDVVQQIQRNSAQAALTGGFSGTGMARNMTARDLGLNSLQLMQQGAGMMQQQTATDVAMTPGRQQLSQLMMTPQQLLARDDQDKTAAANIANQNAILQYQAALKDKGTGGILSSIGGGLMGMAGGGGGGMLGGLMGMFNGGAGGSGGGPSIMGSASGGG